MAAYMYQQPVPVLPTPYDQLDPSRRMYQTSYVPAQQVILPNPPMHPTPMHPAMMQPSTQYSQQPPTYMPGPNAFMPNGVPMMPQGAQMMQMPMEMSMQYQDHHDRRPYRRRSNSINSSYSYINQQLPHPIEYPNSTFVFDYHPECNLCKANHPHPHLQHYFLSGSDRSRHLDQMSTISGLSDLNLSNSRASSVRQDGGMYDHMDWPPHNKYLLEGSGRDHYDSDRGRDSRRSRSVGRFRAKSGTRIETLDVDSDTDLDNSRMQSMLRGRDQRSSRSDLRRQNSFHRASTPNGRFRDEERG